MLEEVDRKNSARDPKSMMLQCDLQENSTQNCSRAFKINVSYQITYLNYLNLD